MRMRRSCGVLLGAAGACLAPPSHAHAQHNPFTEVAASAGIAGETYASATRHSLGVVWFDANNDGYPDILATNGFDDNTGLDLKPHLYLNLTDGTFARSDDLLPILPNYEYVGALAADYDRDGDTDLFLYTANETFSIHYDGVNPPEGPPNLLLKSQLIERAGIVGAGQFIDVATEAGVDDCTPELARLIEPGNPYRCYQTRTATFLDYNLDGWIDLYVGHMVMNESATADHAVFNEDLIYRNAGDGTFVLDHSAIRIGEARRRGALVARSSHLNNDPWPDIYVGNAGNDPFDLRADDLKDVILINDGAGHFDSAYDNIGDDSPAAMGIDFADLNDDGLFDIYITDVRYHYANESDPFRTGNTLYLSNGNGFDANAAVPLGVDFDLSWGTNFADFDLDGTEELFVGSALEGRPSVIYRDIGPTRASIDIELPTTNVRGSAIADYDRDGDPDLLVINEGGTLQLFRNDTPASETNSLVVRPVPTRTNADAFGVRIELVTSSGRRMIRQIKGGTSTHSQDFGEVYFGLRRDTPRCVIVQWAREDAVTQVFEQPEGGVLVVTEPLPIVCDWNRDDVIDLRDVLDFLNDWFPAEGRMPPSGAAAAIDKDGDGTVTVTDLRQYLDCWFDAR